MSTSITTEVATDSSGYLASSQEKIRKYLLSYFSLHDALTWLALFLFAQFVVGCLKFLFPRITHWFLVRKFDNLGKIIHLLFFVIIYFIVDSATGNNRTVIQTITLIAFCFIVVGIIGYLIFCIVVAIIMYIRTRSFRIAFSGFRCLIVDGMVYPVDCFDPVLSVRVAKVNGMKEFKIGTHCLPDMPRDISYRGLFNSYDYTYHTTIQYENTKIIMFRALTNSDSV